jgi:aspartokinase
MSHVVRKSHACFAHIIEGDVEPKGRQRCETVLFESLDALGVKLEFLAVNDAGCSFVIEDADVPRLRSAITQLNMALRLKLGCAYVALPRNLEGFSLPPISRILAALSKVDIDVIHLAGDSAVLAVIVTDQHARRAAEVLADLCLSMSPCHAA